MIVFGKNGCTQVKVLVFMQNWLYWDKKRYYSGRVVSILKSCCIRERVIVFGNSGCIQAKVVVFEQKWLYLGKSSCT